MFRSVFKSPGHLSPRTTRTDKNGSLGPYSYALRQMANIFEPFFVILLLNLIKHKSSAVKACFLQLKAMVKVTISNLATYAGFRLSKLLWVTVPQCTTLSVWLKNEEPHSIVLTSDWFWVYKWFCLFTKVEMGWDNHSLLCHCPTNKPLGKADLWHHSQKL